MQIQISMTPLKRSDNIVAVGIARFGDIRVRGLTLMKSNKGDLFLVMPGKDTGKKDANGKRIFEEIAHPTTKKLRVALNEGAIESFKEGRPVTLRDKEDGRMLIEVEAFEMPYYSRVGKGQMLINDMFVIKDIFINVNKADELYVTMPNYKTTGEGKTQYSELISMGKDFRRQVNETFIDVYNKEKAYLNQNRISIQTKLSSAKEKVIEPTKTDNKIKQMQL